MKDVILEITSKRLGVTAVLNGNGDLVGVVTDGDLRRAIERYENVLSKRASDVMTRNPKVIKKEALATYALKKMEEFSITSLFVVEKEGEKRPIGIIHIHDILKAKIA
jgi:arabinose-5-phosphate isomerase